MFQKFAKTKVGGSSIQNHPDLAHVSNWVDSPRLIDSPPHSPQVGTRFRSTSRLTSSKSLFFPQAMHAAAVNDPCACTIASEEYPVQLQDWI